MLAAAQIGVRQGHQFGRQQRRGFIRQAERGRVSDLSKLPPDGGVDFRMVVPVQIRPDGGIGIEILTAVRIPQHCAAPLHDEDRLALQPIPHLGEWVPDVSVIEFGQLVHALGVAECPIRRSTQAFRPWEILIAPLVLPL